MRAYKFDVGNLHPIGKGDDEPVFVPCNVENDPVVSNNAGVSVLRFDFSWRFPVGATGLAVPGFQRLLRIPTPGLFPECFEGLYGNDSHGGILVPNWDLAGS